MKSLFKLLLGLFVIGSIGSAVILSLGIESTKKDVAKTEAQVREEARQEELKQTVNISRGLCRSMVKDRAKFPDTVKFISVLHQVKGNEVDVRLDWTAENKFGNQVRYKTVCVTNDRKPVLFTVDGKILYDSKA